MVCPRCGCVFCWDDADEWASRDRKRYCGPECEKAADPEAYRRRKRNWRRRKRQLKSCTLRKKRQFEDGSRARAAAQLLLQQRGVQAHTYECPCGYWHLTSLPQDTPTTV